MKIMPLIDAENPALLENVEQLLDADKDMFGEFVGAAVLELAGTKYKSAHGSWLDPRALLRLLIADQMMAQDPELAKTNTGEGKPVARNQRYNLSGSSLANLDLATNLSVGQAYAYLKQLRQQAGGNQDLFPDFAWAKVVVSTHLYMNDDIWAGAVGLADASGKKFINAEDLSFDMSAARKAAKTPAQKRWLRHIKAWPHDFDAWQNYASQENRATHTVNQAVCNEVAELTQAKCDIALPGGLKENAKWFADKTKGGLHQIMNADQDLWPCTSLFWLEWVSKNPGGSNSVDYRTNVSFFPDGAGGRHQLSSEGTYETEKYTYFLYKSGSEGPYNTSPECLAGTGQNCLLKRHDKGGKVEWAKWKHQATVAFPPHRDGVVTFEPEMPGQTHNISRLRWRGLSELSEPHVMVGQDNGLESRVQRPSQAALPKLYDLAHGQKVEDKRTIDYDSPIWKQILSKN